MKTNKITKLLSYLIFGVLLLISCGKNNDPQESTEFPFKDKLISYEKSRILYDEYTTEKYPILNSIRPDSLPDSREYWFSLDQMEAYLKYVRTKAEAKGLKNLGIRVYMGAYPKDSTKSEYPGYQTIYFYPTTTTKENRTALLPGINSHKLSLQGEEESTNVDIEDIDGMNYGHLHPPK